MNWIYILGAIAAYMFVAAVFFGVVNAALSARKLSVDAMDGWLLAVVFWPVGLLIVAGIAAGTRMFDMTTAPRKTARITHPYDTPEAE